MKKKNENIISFTNALKFVTGIISWVVLVILVLIAVMLVYYFLATKIYGEKGENYKPAFSLYTILSASMEPNIKVFDVIVDVNVRKPEDIKVGDVITFISSSNLTTDMTITHRVIEVVKDGDNYSYKTQGDANLIPDNTNAEYKNVLGKVIFKIPQLGRLQEFLGQKGGWLIVIVIPALGIIISDILKIFRLSGAKTSVNNLNAQEENQKEHEEQVKNEIENNLYLRYSDKIDQEEKNQNNDEENYETKETTNKEEYNELEEEQSISTEEENSNVIETSKIEDEETIDKDETAHNDKEDLSFELPALKDESSDDTQEKEIPFELPKLAKDDDKKD